MARPRLESRCTPFGCEAGIVRNIRRHLLNERAIDRAQAQTQGYWKYGAMDHPDNDRGQDTE